MKKLLLPFLLLFLTQTFSAEKINYIDISQKFLKSVKSKSKKTDYYINILAKADKDSILKQLVDDKCKKAFFINLYNAYCNSALRKNPDLFKKRSLFFGAKQFDFAGNKISLDVIEHGFLRKSMTKMSRGKMHNLFPSQLEKDFRVEKLDYRIHFALNCGAKSCPKIDIYSSKKIENQLADSEKKFLKKNSKYDKKTKTLFVSSLMSWYRGDFGDKSGIIDIHRNLKIIPKGEQPNISFKDYDWTLNLDSFR